MKRLLKWLALIFVSCAGILFLIYFLFPGLVIDFSIWSARRSAGVVSKEAPGEGFRWPYLEGGNGETVVLFHGFGMSGDLWGDLLPALSKKFRVVTPDMPGFGNNTRVKEASYDLKGQAHLLDRFLGRLGLKTFHLVGFSMGGGVAAWYAAEFPGKVRKLVLIDAFGVKASKKTDTEKALDRGEKLLVFRTVAEYDALMALAYFKAPDIPGHIKRHIATLGAKDYDFHRMIFDSLGKDGLGVNEMRLGRINAPTLVLWGAEDRIFDVSCAEKYCAGIKNCSKVIVSGSGHMVYIEKAGESVRAVMSFLADN